jgi:proline iminopeptidase
MMGQPLYQPGMVREAALDSSITAPEQTGDENFWQVEDDIRLWHFSAGEGRNVLIVHGGPGAPFLEPLTGLEPLTDQYRFHYFDQRGCGQSTRPFDRFDPGSGFESYQLLEQKLGLGAQIADIERIRQILGEEKLILIGHSFGGFTASLYAAEFPEHVEALILIAPANLLVMPQKEGDLFEEVRARLPEDMLADYDAYMDEYMNYQDLFTKSEADLVAENAEFGVYYQEALGFDLPEQGEMGGWMVQAQYVSIGSRHDYRDALRDVDVPVLVIHGADDLQTESVSRIYSDTFPNAQFEVIDEATHFPFEEQPEAFARVVATFLGGLE